ncbi:1-deoxy-D-xylulose-5-phosphate synthase [Saccharothrix tamanrassetensis]|uniref:1-deoxy-D-xylulose-5-phosphate synthase n=1 Tax=Saccharothrix tamanrassetensis TaxID=1051531 RepID=A0A841CMT2_9PSEU|nr:1-deoxy-D-xylulose-5-phosphate synthase [Saccharothrix tamanrassetensis]MBB5957305.1 1-deoxy-D-xylulose-5-phosphate synthase [Saccharothrix tamanrassetensis]
MEDQFAARLREGDGINPADVKALSHRELCRFADAVRAFLVENVVVSGGHLGSNLGVVELTLALHRTFSSPADRIIWDTGHQAYVHKVVTGRSPDFRRLRVAGGMSGYPSRKESDHDLVENSHASTALSYADGFAKANALRHNEDSHVIAVIGDGSLTGGMAWEALNNIGDAQRKVIVVLNDNGRSYSPTVGVVSHRLHDDDGGSGLFEQLGLRCVGPVDGHDLVALEEAFELAKQAGGPVLVHCRTTKGLGYRPAETDEVDHLHAVPPRRAEPATAPSRGTWTQAFEEELLDIAEERPDIVAVTAAMLHPVGLGRFAERYPDRVFDVGLAEQHAVTSSAAMAMAGLRPVVPIYSTFLNRAFDQLLLDCGLHECPVTFVLDRSGITGEDGPSHHGMWDLSLLRIVPNMQISAPRDGATLRRALRRCLETAGGPTAIRFPKGELPEDLAASACDGLDVLHGEAHPTTPRDVLILAVGAMATECLAAAMELEAGGITVTVVDPRWVHPLPPAVADIAAQHRVALSVEDNTRTGGVGTAFLQLLSDLRVRTPVRTLAVEAAFQPHGNRRKLLADLGLTGAAIADAAHASLCGHLGEQPFSTGR